MFEVLRCIPVVVILNFIAPVGPGPGIYAVLASKAGCDRDFRKAKVKLDEGNGVCFNSNKC